MSSPLFKRGKGRLDEEYEKKRRSTSSIQLTPSASKREERTRRTISFLNKPTDSRVSSFTDGGEISKVNSFAIDTESPRPSTLSLQPSPVSSFSSRVSDSSGAPPSLSLLLKSIPPTLTPEAEAVLHNFHAISPSDLSLHLSPLLHLLFELFFRSFSLPMDERERERDRERERKGREEEEEEEEEGGEEDRGARVCVSAFNAIVRIICVCFAPNTKQSDAFYKFFSSEINLSSYPLLDEKFAKASLYVLSAFDLRSAPVHVLAHALRHVFHVISIFRLSVSESSEKLSAEALGSLCTRVLSMLGSVTVLGLAAQPVAGSEFCPMHSVCESQPYPAFKETISTSLNLFDCIIKTTNAQAAIPGIRKFFDFSLTTKIGKQGVNDVLETVRQFCAHEFPKEMQFALFPKKGKKQGVNDVLETVRQFCAHEFPKEVQFALFPSFLRGILCIFGILSTSSLSMVLPKDQTVDLNKEFQETLVKTLCIIFEILEGPVPPAVVLGLLEYLPPLAELATTLADPFTFLDKIAVPENGSSDSNSGMETLGETAARCVMNLLKLVKPEQLDELVDNITAQQGRAMLRGIIVVMHTHLANIPLSAPALRYATLTSLLLFLQPLVSHLDLFQSPDADVFNGSGVREVAYWNALFCFVPTYLYYLKKFLRNPQEIDQLSAMALSVFEMLMSHAGLSRRLTPFGNDLLKVVPFLPFSVMFLCDTHESTAKKSRDIGKSLFFSLLTVHIDKLGEFEHSVALAIHKLFLTGQLTMPGLHLAFEDMEYSYEEMEKETGDARVHEIVMVLRRLKVLAYSWGKIHSDEQKYQYLPVIEDLNATLDSYAALASHFTSHSKFDIAEVYYKRQAMYLSAVGCHTESANVLVLIAGTCCKQGSEQWDTYIRGAIEQYIKASLWTRAVVLYRELKKQNEFVKDYHRVAQIQLSIAKVYDSLAFQSPPPLLYYFVVFYGRDFNLLNGAKFIYCDPHQSTTPQEPQKPLPLFASRMLDCHPSARAATPSVERLILTHENMPSSLTLLPGKYIFILQLFPLFKSSETKTILDSPWQTNAFSKQANLSEEHVKRDEEQVVVTDEMFPGTKLRSHAKVVPWHNIKPPNK